MLLHGVLILSLLLVGHQSWFPQWVSPEGFCRFASDSIGNHQQALELVGFLKSHDFGMWWSMESRFHTRLASFFYWQLGPWLGYNILSLWTLNAGALSATFWGWEKCRALLSPEKESKLMYIWIVFPILLMHFTQLLRDPFYMMCLMWWVYGWLMLLKGDSKPRNSWRAFCLLLLVSPFLFWVRERFWILAQLVSLLMLTMGFVLVVLKKIPKLSFVLILLLAMGINLKMVVRLAQSLVHFETNFAQEQPMPPDQKFTYFYKIGKLRSQFTRNYAQASSGIDHHVLFHTDRDVIAYVPRALQIGLATPFPNRWFNGNGKTGRVGRWLAAYEWSLMLIVSLGSLWNWCKVRTLRREHLAILGIFLLAVLALGLVVTNGGALYRMRWPFWLLVLAVMNVRMRWSKDVTFLR